MPDHSFLSPWISGTLHIILSKVIAMLFAYCYRSHRNCARNGSMRSQFMISRVTSLRLFSRNWKGCGVARLVRAIRDSPRSMR